MREAGEAPGHKMRQKSRRNTQRRLNIDGRQELFGEEKERKRERERERARTEYVYDIR